MLIEPGKIRTWLYTSQFRDAAAHGEILALKPKFDAKNKAADLTGFLITNGTSVMQLLEGPDAAVDHFKSVISEDPRHHSVVNEVYELEAKRAYPHWSMRYHEASEYEALFSTIESARLETIAINIAHLLFDSTFDTE